MDNDTALIALSEFLCETREPQACWPTYWFEEVSFTRWAAGELMKAIMDHPMVPAMDTIEKFAIKMTAYHALSDGTKAEPVFFTAAEFAYGILDIFREEYENA